MRIKSKVWIGSVFCILSACLWGVSGAVGQYLFNQAGISPEWLVSARCLLTGLLLLVFYQVKHGGVFSIWMDKQDRIGIIIFALGGMLFMQYGYFAAIAHSNAATATVLQYTAGADCGLSGISGEKAADKAGMYRRFRLSDRDNSSGNAWQSEKPEPFAAGIILGSAFLHCACVLYGLSCAPSGKI